MNSIIWKNIARLLVVPIFLCVMCPLALATNLETNPPVGNFAKVSPGLYRGRHPSDSALRELAAGGIKTIVDLRMDWEGTKSEEELARSLGLNYFHIPMGFMTPDPGAIEAFMQIVRNPQNQPVFVHCRQGADRTGTVVGIYRIVEEGWTFEQAYEEMRRHNFKPFLLLMKNTVAQYAKRDRFTNEPLQAAN